MNITKSAIINNVFDSMFNLLWTNLGIALPNTGLIRILYAKFSILLKSNKNLFVLDSSKANLINIIKLIKSGIKENKKFIKSSLFFSNKYLRKKIGDSIVE